MRIIAGTLKGRTFDAPHGHRTHPMSDKMRGALFAILGDIDGQEVLDAFAGSGAISFEAISRGASRVTAIESDRLAQRAIAGGIASLGLQDRAKLISASVGAWLSTSDRMFDIVIADPPYDDLQQPLLARLTDRVKRGGLFVLSWPGNLPPPVLDPLMLVSQKSYGDGQLIFYRSAN